MAHRLAPIALLGLTTLLCACGDSDNAPGPGGVTVGEARALDEAAEMIEQQPSIADASNEPAGKTSDGRTEEGQ